MLKRVCVRESIPFSASMDKTLVSDPLHGATLELSAERDVIIARSPRGLKHVPMSNVQFYEPYSAEEWEQANLKIVRPTPIPVAAPTPVQDGVKYIRDKRTGKAVEVSRFPTLGTDEA
jgi:hypothetical protein